MNEERPIEKLLRRYARKRRDQAGDSPVLHPATRRLLQGEVARQFPKPAPETKPASTAELISVFARRWIYAVGIFVVMGVAAAMLLPTLSKSKSRTTLAQKTTSETHLREGEALAAAPTLAPAPPSAEVQPTLTAAESRPNQPALEPSGGGNLVRLRDESATLDYSVTNGVAAGAIARFADAKSDVDSLRKAEERPQIALGTSLDAAVPASRALIASAPMPTRTAGEAQPADTVALAGGVRSRDDRGANVGEFNELRRTPTATSGAPAVPASAATGSQDKRFVARGGGVEKEAERFYSQSFANVSAEQLKAKAAKVQTAAPAILANFQVQNVGNEVRVIDSDGSTYLGVVSPEAAGQAGDILSKDATATFKNAELGRAQTATAAGTGNQQGAQNYLWRAEGTNRTLNQNVVFLWNFVDVTNTLAAVEAKAVGGTLNQDLTKLPSQFPMMLQNSSINGRAQIGPAQQIEVNAVPLK